MRCSKFREWINLSLDGELPADGAVPLGEHLEACHECRQYREDLLLGQRMLRATEPSVRDDFEWRLQLKLNQTLAEAARETVVPWQHRETGTWSWVRNFGFAGAAGLAAVLLFSLVIWPAGDIRTEGGQADQQSVRVVGADPAARDRLPLTSTWTPPDFGKRFVGANDSWAGSRRGGNQARRLEQWSGENLADLRVITGLRSENRLLRQELLMARMQYRVLQAQLDTVACDSEHTGGQ